MERPFVSLLTDFFNANGKKLLDQPDRFRSLFLDFTQNEYRAEAQIFSQFLASKQAQELKNNEDVDALVMKGIAERFQKTFLFERGICESVVMAYAFLLGLIDKSTFEMGIAGDNRDNKTAIKISNQSEYMPPPEQPNKNKKPHDGPSLQQYCYDISRENQNDERSNSVLPAGKDLSGWQHFTNALKKHVVFSGRARRAEYFSFIVILSIFSFLVPFLFSFLTALYFPLLYVITVFITVQAVFLLPNIAVSIRRMHDVDKSGWYILIPLYNTILTFTPGTEGSNKYGPDPKKDGK